MDLFRALFRLIVYVFCCIFITRIAKSLKIIYESILIHFFYEPFNIGFYHDYITVVVGADETLGSAITIALANDRQFKKFFLVGTDSDKLNEVKFKLDFHYGAKAMTAVVDMSDDIDINDLPLPTEEDQKDILDMKDKKNKYGVIVLCAKGERPKFGNLLQRKPEEASDILQKSLMLHVKYIERLGVEMLNRNRGVIVSVLPMNCWRPVPYLSSYPAAAVSLYFITKALAEEFQKRFFKACTVAPLAIVESVEEKWANPFALYPKDFARETVRTLGLTAFYTGTFQHDVQLAFLNLIPRCILKAWYIRKIDPTFNPRYLFNAKKDD